MYVEVNGMKKLDFTAQDGSAVKGTQLFISFDDPEVVGTRTDKIFIRDGMALPAGLKPGVALSIDFDMKGKVVAVTEVE